MSDSHPPTEKEWITQKGEWDNFFQALIPPETANASQPLQSRIKNAITSHIKHQPPDNPAAMQRMVDICHQHELSGAHLPWAFFSAGRLELLLENPHAALNHYALGIRHCLNRNAESLFEDELTWLESIHKGQQVPPMFQWAIDLFKLASKSKTATVNPDCPRILIIAGGAGSIAQNQLPALTAYFTEILSGFKGVVISGGTPVGVPGAVGSVPNRSFKLIGYLPTTLPAGVEKDPRYDQLIEFGPDFSPAQPLKYWNDLLDQGANPANVVLIGYAGGLLSAFEYHLAHMLGAQTCPIVGSGGAADEFANDPLWINPQSKYT